MWSWKKVKREPVSKAWESLTNWLTSSIPWRNNRVTVEGTIDGQLSAIYSKSALIYACIHELTSSISEAPLKIVRENTDGDKEETTDLELQRLFYGNPNFSYNEIINLIVARLHLTGSSYMEKLRNAAGSTVTEIFPHPSRNVELKSGKKMEQLIDKFVIMTDQNTMNGRDVEPDDMVWHRFIDPHSNLNAVGPLEAAWQEANLDEEHLTYLTEMLINAKVPGVSIESDKTINSETKKTILETIQDAVGRGKRGGALVLGGGAKLNVNVPLQQFDFPGLQTLSETRLCACFGIPPIIPGFKAGLQFATYANYKEARKSFYRETLMPLWEMIESTLTRSLIIREGKDLNLSFQFDLTEIAELQEDDAEMMPLLTAAVNGGVLMPDEARVRLGMDPLPNGLGQVIREPLSALITPVTEERAEPIIVEPDTGDNIPDEGSDHDEDDEDEDAA